MKDKELHNFSFISTFLTDLEDLPYEQRCQIIDAICYWGVYRELPSEIENNSLAVALLKNAQRMIKKQDEYKKEKQNDGKKKVPANLKITDEQIKEGYIELWKKTGEHPSEQQVIEYSGADVKRIGGRDAWKELKNDFNKCLEEYDKEHMNVMDVKESLTNVTHNALQDTYNDIHKKQDIFNF